MAEDKNRNQSSGGEQPIRQEKSIGNRQETTQTGAQNNGGQTIKQHNDQYTEDLRKSGDRSSSESR